MALQVSLAGHAIHPSSAHAPRLPRPLRGLLSHGAISRTCACPATRRVGSGVTPWITRSLSSEVEGDTRDLDVTDEVNQELDSAGSDAAQKQAEADRLRAAERFMTVGTGEAECKGCGYTYDPKNGDPDYPVSKGTQFQNLPDDWQCPVCGGQKDIFITKQKEVAGFAENQGYGLGANSMTGEQKSLTIFGSLLFFFVLFILGYFLN